MPPCWMSLSYSKMWHFAPPLRVDPNTFGVRLCDVVVRKRTGINPVCPRPKPHLLVNAQELLRCPPIRVTYLHLRNWLTNRGQSLYAREMTSKKDPAAVALGRKGGKAVAQRGPEYFRQLQARRKHRKGGRPRKATGSS